MLHIILVLARTTMLNTNFLHDLQVLKLCVTSIKGILHVGYRSPAHLKLRIGIKADSGRTDEKANQISLGQ